MNNETIDSLLDNDTATSSVEVLPYTPPVVTAHLGNVATAYELFAEPPDQLIRGDGAQMVTQGTTVLPNGGHRLDFDP